MALTVNFYNFSKKNNSTKVPSGTGTEAPSTYQCILKEDCSILAPVIIMEAGLTSRLAFNYCYIADFQRYYFVTDWTWSGRHWIASLSVDVLGTYKTQIGSSSLYVLRSASQSNGRVTDNKYPIIAKPYTYIDDIGNYVGTTWTQGLVYEMYQSTLDPSPQPYQRVDYFTKTLSTGYYYIGVVGANLSGVTWYCMTPGSFNTLVQSLMNANITDMPDISPGLALQLADPLQYIVSCYWLPTDILGITYPDSGIDINFGRFPIHVNTCAQFDPINDMHEYRAVFNLRKHPQAATRGTYLNQGPYSRYTVVFAPFGTYELDASLMIDDTTANCSWYIDYTTGLADLTIKVTNSFMVHTTAMLGVPIRLNQATFDYLGAGTGMVGGILGAAGSLLTGNIPGAVGAVTGAVGSGLQAMNPKITGKGSSGNFVPFHSFLPKIYTDFYEVANEYNTDLGRPLCEVKQINTLSGYVLCEEGDEALNEFATETERDQIRSYLTGGMFYE